MMRMTLAAAAALSLAAASAAHAADATLASQLAGNTLSADMFLPHDNNGPGGELDRVMFQAYLEAGGKALVRRWDAARDAYTLPAEGRWTADQSTLCLDIPGLPHGGSNVCVDVHVWGPRIAGNTAGGGRFALIDGDLAPGNTLVAAP